MFCDIIALLRGERKFEVVWFNVAWIQVTEYSEDEYIGALGLWLC